MSTQTFFLAQCGAAIAAVDYGYGRPVDTMSHRQATKALEASLPTFCQSI